MSQDFHQNRHHHHQSFDDEQVDKIHQSFVGGGQVVYESAGMLSEMFDFGGGRTTAPGEQLLAARSPQQQFHGQPQYTWIPDGVVEGQGLSLSLASSEEMRMSTAAAAGYPPPPPHPHEMMFFNNTQEGRPTSASTSSNSLHQHLHFGFNTASSSVFSLAAVNVLRNSNYTRPAQELLDEFCSVGRAHLNKTTATSKLAVAANNTTDPPPLSPADKMEHQRRKVKLAAMLDEVERRYSHYCEQMQMVVNSYDMVMGFGAAVPYTALAQKAMSRHFRCLKDSIQAQLKHSSELLGEKDATGGTGITKGETPRLKVLEQSLRKQRAFHQMGMMEQEAWRPQRGLPERSVNVLRAWLFEHFLNPYPSDADKHLLARQTGLSRNQVANWFINARVRLWKPMIEEMYQQDKSKHVEDKGGEEDEDVVSDKDEEQEEEEQTTRERESNSSAQTSTYPPTVSHTFKAHLMMPNRHHHQHPAVGPTTNSQGFIQATASSSSTSAYVVDAFNNHFTGTSTSTAIVDDNRGVSGPTMIRFGTTPATNTGDVSLTLGLRHGSAEKGGFIFRDFGTS